MPAPSLPAVTLPQPTPVCVYCEASRVCAMCYGYGWRDTGSQYIAADRRERCGSCSGSGACPYCGPASGICTNCGSVGCAYCREEYQR